MNKRVWIIFAVVIVAALGGLIFWRNQNEVKQSYDYVKEIDQDNLVTRENILAASEKSGVKINDQKNLIPDHFVGKKDAKVVVKIYQDFACSHCQAFHNYAEKIIADYSDRVLFISRNFFLNFPNSTATLSAGEAAYVVGGEEKYQQFANLLFRDETFVGQAVPADQRKNIFDSYAKQVGLDETKFSQALMNTTTNGVQDKIERDKKLAEKDKVTGTPTWFVDGKKIDEVREDAIRGAIEKALKK